MKDNTIMFGKRIVKETLLFITISSLSFLQVMGFDEDDLKESSAQRAQIKCREDFEREKQRFFLSHANYLEGILQRPFFDNSEESFLKILKRFKICYGLTQTFESSKAQKKFLRSLCSFFPRISW